VGEIEYLLMTLFALSQSASKDASRAGDGKMGLDHRPKASSEVSAQGRRWQKAPYRSELKSASRLLPSPVACACRRSCRCTEMFGIYDDANVPKCPELTEIFVPFSSHFTTRLA
jgi:hypothetical protein